MKKLIYKHYRKKDNEVIGKYVNGKTNILIVNKYGNI